jgi:hypothetical protein
MLEAVVLALALANAIVIGMAGHMTSRLAVYAGLMAFAAVVILLAKSNIMFPRQFNEAVRTHLGPAGANNFFDRKNLLGWGLIAICSYLVAISAF